MARGSMQKDTNRGGSDEGEQHFEDKLNPGTKKGGHPANPTKEAVNKQTQAIHANVTGKGKK